MKINEVIWPKRLKAYVICPIEDGFKVKMIGHRNMWPVWNIRQESLYIWDHDQRNAWFVFVLNRRPSLCTCALSSLAIGTPVSQIPRRIKKLVCCLKRTPKPECRQQQNCKHWLITQIFTTRGRGQAQAVPRRQNVQKVGGKKQGNLAERVKCWMLIHIIRWLKQTNIDN